MKPMSPWKKDVPCPHPSFPFFRTALMNASFHSAGPLDETGSAKSQIQLAAKVAIDAEWPYWAMERMFREIAPLVAWDQFMQAYINILHSAYVMANDKYRL